MQIPSLTRVPLGRPTPRSVAVRYVGYMTLGGTTWSMLAFGEVIARKSLGVSGLWVTLLTMLMPLASLTSLWWGRILLGRDQRRLLVFIGTVAFVVLFTGGGLRWIWHLLFIHLVYFIAVALFGPAENRVLQQHIASESTGRTYGLASGLRAGMAAVFAAFAGWWMDSHTAGYQHLYMLVAVAGYLGLRLLAGIPTRPVQRPEPYPIDRRLIMAPPRAVVDLLRRRPDFLRFEAAFMVYGIAFMILLPVVPLYLVDDLNLSYSQIGIARVTVTQAMMIAGIPFFGRIFDRTTPHRLGVIIYALLAIYPLLLLSASLVPPHWKIVAVAGAFALFGAVMSGVIVLWHLASIRFAGDDDAGLFQSVHIAATGVRGSFAPLLGYFVMTRFDKTTAMLVSSALWLVAAFLMWLMRRLDVRSGAFRSLRA